MSTQPHERETVAPYDGGLHICRKCKCKEQGGRPATHDCNVTDADFNAAVLLGQVGLYRTRLRQQRKSIEWESYMANVAAKNALGRRV